MQIVRYISFGRFLDFLAKGLAVPKASCFDDKWEGLTYFSHLSKFSTSEDGFKWNAPIEWIYVTCWHAETEECDAMWKLYGRSDTAVAIETSDEKLEHALISENLGTLIQSANVTYQTPGSERLSSEFLTSISGTGDQSRAWTHAIALFHKHKAFSFEKEFRVTIVDSTVVNVGDMRELPKHNPQSPLFLSSAKNPKFLDKITVSPSAPSAMIKIIEAVLATHEIKAPVVKSALAM